MLMQFDLVHTDDGVAVRGGHAASLARRRGWVKGRAAGTWPLIRATIALRILRQEEDMALSKTFPCDAAAVGKILGELKSLGAEVEGSEQEGKLVGNTMMGHFEGTYRHDGTNLTLAITQKPALIPESFLQGRLDELARKFGGVA
jgi:hypothetical protein